MPEERKYLDDAGTTILWGKIKDRFAPKSSPTFTGTPTSVTPTAGDNSEKIATTAFVNTAISGKADRADIPVVDAALSGTSTNAIQNKAVKGALDLKAPLASPALTGTPTAPTAASGTNTTQIATTAFVKTAVDNAISGITGISFEKVASVSDLPVTGASGTIYLVPHSGTSPDIYDEYIWVVVDDTTTPATYGYEKVGTTQIDLSGYWSKSELVAITSAELDAICV